MIKPNGIISASEAKELNDNWTKLRAKANDLAAGKPDNRSSWYSLEDIEAFINLIKQENKNVNGIRFYLGVQASENDSKGLTTVFMVPTEDNGKEKNQDIPGANGLDRGHNGYPPNAEYPQ